MWLEEQLEFNGLRADPRTPRALQMPVASFELPNGRYGHAFQGGGVALSSYNYYEWEEEEAARPGDSTRLALALDLLDSVNFLHCRGSAHLALDSEVVRVMPTGSGPSGLVRLRSRLSLVGLGASVRLQSRVGRNAFQLPANTVAFHAPELLDGYVIESNLRALLAADSWSVGVLLAMILGGTAAWSQRRVGGAPCWSRHRWLPWHPGAGSQGSCFATHSGPHRGLRPGRAGPAEVADSDALSHCPRLSNTAGWSSSPFEAEADWGKGTFSAEAAVLRRQSDVQGAFGPFLWRLNQDSGGLLFRNGWLAQLVVGMLMPQVSSEGRRSLRAWVRG